MSAEAIASIDSLRTSNREVSFGTLLQGAKRGDGRAFSTLFTQHSPRVHAFLAARRVEDPEALTNEVFVRAFLRIDSFRGSESGFVGWVFQIARNLVIDDHRRRSRRITSQPLPRSDQMPIAVVPIDHWLEHEAGIDSVDRLLVHLTPLQREVVLLRGVAGLSFKEIGAAIERRPAAARAVWKRAREVLAAAIEAEHQ